MSEVFAKGLYDQWIEYVFNRPITPNGWYFDFDLDAESFEASPSEVTKLVAETCKRAETDLIKFSDEQVDAGLNFIFNDACSRVVFDIKDSSVPDALRLECIDAIYSLYEGCYRLRCTESLSHLNEKPDTPLNNSCYMLWDVSALAFWKDDQKMYYSAVISLLGRVLNIPHQACMESALHGLGHIYDDAPEEVEAVIDAWLRADKTQRPELLTYAKAARVGRVQ